jgi:MerR family transcriptional regulator, light-induced transcriptional regulator
MLGLTQDRVTSLDSKRESAGSAQSPPRAADQGPGHETLARTMDQQVIPHLVVSHRRLSALSEQTVLPDRGDVVEFTGLLANGCLPEARAKIEQLHGRGMTPEALCLHLLVPSARRMSDLWEADLCQYEEIAVGLMHLQQMLHDLGAQFAPGQRAPGPGRKVLLISAPGERTLLGVFMVSEFFRCVTSEFFHRSGWDVWRAPPLTRATLSDLVRRQHFDVIDVSATCESRLETLTEDLAEFRRNSRNRQVAVTVGGPVFFDHPELAVTVGADSASSNPRHAVELADVLFARAEGRTATKNYY